MIHSKGHYWSSWTNFSKLKCDIFQASTIDGKVTAMDIEKNGEVVWIVDADKVPLLSSSLNQQKVIL